MNKRLVKSLDGLKQAVMTANPSLALSRMEDVSALIRRQDLTPDAKAECAARMEEVRNLAEASAKGAARAIDQVRAILEAARNLQAYDQSGRRITAPVSAPAVQRF